MSGTPLTPQTRAYHKAPRARIPRHGRSSTRQPHVARPQTRTLEHQATTRARAHRHGHSSTRQPQAPRHKLLFRLMEHSCYSSKNKNIKDGVRDTTVVRTFMSFSKNIQLKKKKGKKRKSYPEAGLDTCKRATSLAKQTRSLKSWDPQSPSLGRTAEPMRAAENAQKAEGRKFTTHTRVRPLSKQKTNLNHHNRFWKYLAVRNCNSDAHNGDLWSPGNISVCSVPLAKHSKPATSLWRQPKDGKSPPHLTGKSPLWGSGPFLMTVSWC